MDWISRVFISVFFCLYIVILAYGEPTLPTLAIATDEKNHRILNYRGVNRLHCNVSTDIPSNLALKWHKEDKLFEPTESRFEFKGNQLVIRRTEESDMSNYMCVLVEKEDPSKIVARSNTIECLGKPTAKIVVVSPTSNPVDEGGKIKLECVVQSKPPALIHWEKDESRLITSGRILLSDVTEENRVASHAYLEISEVEMGDRGTYSCTAQNPKIDSLNGTRTEIFVRVKDRLAALWPFIGICAEVLVLCIIIFFYERKRNKTELDESDTDQSPEQKNTPDHGKDTVRQRK